MRPVLVQYPGVAKWLLMHGRVMSEYGDRFEVDMDRLRRAGVGEDRALVFALVFSTAMSAIMTADERIAHDDEGPRDHAHVIAELRSSTRSRAAEEMAAFIPAPGRRSR